MRFGKRRAETHCLCLTSEQYFAIWPYIPAERGSKKGKAIPSQVLDRPRGFQEVEAPRFQDNRHMKVVRLSVIPPRKYSWYSFLLEAESTPGTQCSRKDYVNEKFQ
jgi:hypothetical protein